VRVEEACATARAWRSAWRSRGTSAFYTVTDVAAGKVVLDATHNRSQELRYVFRVKVISVRAARPEGNLRRRVVIALGEGRGNARPPATILLCFSHGLGGSRAHALLE
jgi:hypothetical protein